MSVDKVESLKLRKEVGEFIGDGGPTLRNFELNSLLRSLPHTTLSRQIETSRFTKNI